MFHLSAHEKITSYRRPAFSKTEGAIFKKQKKLQESTK